MKRVKYIIRLLFLLILLVPMMGCVGNNNPEEVFVTFLNHDNTVLQHDKIQYGTKAIYEGVIPEKQATASNVFSFIGWDKNIEEPCYTDTIFKAEFDSEIREYIVTFINYNGDVLQTVNVSYGAYASYNGSIPEKQSNDERVEYSFIGWDKNINDYLIYEDTTFYAEYETINYVFAYFVYEGDEQYNYTHKTKVGTAPDVEMYMPYYEENDVARFVAGFDKNIKEPIYEDTTYNAVWVIKNIYDVEFKLATGKTLYKTRVLEGDDAEYVGETPSKESHTTGDYHYTYKFCGWDSSLENIQSDTTFIAQFIVEKEYIGYELLIDEIKKDVKNQGTYENGIYSYVFSIDTTSSYMYTGIIDYDTYNDELDIFYASFKNDGTIGSSVYIYIPNHYNSNIWFKYKYVSSTVNNEGAGDFYAPTFTSSSTVSFSWHSGDMAESASATLCTLLISMALDSFAKSSTYDMSVLGFDNYDY